MRLGVVRGVVLFVLGRMIATMTMIRRCRVDESGVIMFMFVLLIILICLSFEFSYTDVAQATLSVFGSTHCGSLVSYMSSFVELGLSPS